MESFVSNPLSVIIFSVVVSAYEIRQRTVQCKHSLKQKRTCGLFETYRSKLRHTRRKKTVFLHDEEFSWHHTHRRS